MASNSIPIEELDDEFLRCPTCRERYFSPKALHCQHVFCAGCLQKWVSKKSGKLHCPICRCEQKLSSLGIDGLPDSLLTKNLLELVGMHQEQNAQAQTDSDITNSLHTVSSVSASLFCVHHAGAELTVFCETCSTPLCQQCSAEDEHLGHDLVDLTQACADRRRRLLTVREKLDARVWRAQQKVSSLRLLEEQLDKDKDIAESHIRGHCDLSIDLVQKYENKLLNELDDKFDELLNTYQGEKDKAQLPIWVAWSEFVDATLHCTSDVDFIRREKVVRENFQRLELKASDEASVSDLACSLRFHSNDEFLNQFRTNHIGNVAVEKNQDPPQSPGLIASGRKSTFVPKFRVAFSIDKFWCSYNWTTRTLEYPHAVAVSGRGNIFVVDSTEQVHVFNDRGEFIRHFRPSFTSNKPWPVNTFDITVVNEEEIGITDLTSKRVFICSMEGRIKRRCGGSPLRSPAGIAAGKDGKIYVVDNKACRVVVFNLSGKCLHYIGHHSDGPGRLKNPQHVAVNSWNQVIVTDQDETSKNRICVFDAHGEFIHEFGPSSVDDGHILAPRSITCDPNNNILVSSHRRVVILGPDGTFLDRVDGADGDFIQDPRGIDTIVLDGQLRVVVADSNTGCVKVLSQTN
ncbi:tripartite motif-containing protein 2-like [Ptychodera flava]|uniref:tripartite motif-containing protein 2-like n=1 Tax=Ptychodera flava TaxID=63121 RepID=UPI00396A7EC6